MKRALWVGLVAVGLLSAVAHLPASLLDARLAAATDGRWRLASAKGSLWQGSGQLMYAGSQGEVLPMSTLAWRWQPAALRSLAMQWDIDADGQTGSLQLKAAGVALHNLQLQLPVAALTGFSSKWHSARLGGQLQLQLGQMAWQAGRVEGQAALAWVAASSPLSRIQPFGSYALDVQGQGEQVQLVMRTVQGPLQIQGQGRYDANGLQFAGTASSEPAQYEALKPVLLMLGKPDGPNSVAWRLN